MSFLETAIGLIKTYHREDDWQQEARVCHNSCVMTQTGHSSYRGYVFMI